MTRHKLVAAAIAVASVLTAASPAAAYVRGVAPAIDDGSMSCSGGIVRVSWDVNQGQPQRAWVRNMTTYEYGPSTRLTRADLAAGYKDLAIPNYASGNSYTAAASNHVGMDYGVTKTCTG